MHENEKKWPAGQAVLAGGWLKLFMTHLTLSFSLSSSTFGQGPAAVLHFEKHSYCFMPSSQHHLPAHILLYTSYL